MNCPFCQIDNTKIYNQTIEETKNFIIKPTLGSIVPGYILVIPKKHVSSILNLDLELKKEYKSILNKYRCIFKKMYGIYPLIFEHGTIDSNESTSQSVIHAHTHIVNYNYKWEKEILKKLNFFKINSLEVTPNKNYIYYVSPKGVEYLTLDFLPQSQLMRKLIANDLNIKEQYDWHKFPFLENTTKTINDLKEYKD